MAKTDIGWVDQNLNFLTWMCIKVSEGCRNCYAESLAKRTGKTFYGAPEWREAAMKEYNALKAGDSVFMNTMSDSFHPGVAVAWIQKWFALARQKPQVNFLFLTKRPERALELAEQLDWSPNIWIGTSVESRKWLKRLDILRDIPTENRFSSIEPLLEDLGYVDLSGIKGILVGGESGQNRRPFEKDWARHLRDQAATQSVAFFFKQGSDYAPGQDRELDGRTYDDVAWSINKLKPDAIQESLF